MQLISVLSYLLKHVHFISSDDVMTLILINSCTVVFITKKKKKKKKNSKCKHIYFFLRNAYKCSFRPRTYVAEVVPEHLYMSRLMTKPTK